MNSKSRLNMGHGFMKSIIRNQLDRDNYDKEMKAKGCTRGVPPSLATTKKAKKPDIHTYAPPMVRSQDCRNNEQSEENVYLFTFEYEDEDGELFHLVVNRGDDADSLARQFGEERDLDRLLIDALSEFLQEQINKRTSTKGS